MAGAAAGGAGGAAALPALLPALPFPPEQLAVPGSVRLLHLFEARYLALLEECQRQPSSPGRPRPLLVHLSVAEAKDPMGNAGWEVQRESCLLCELLDFRQVDLGVLATVRAVEQVYVEEVEGDEVYLQALTTPVVREAGRSGRAGEEGDLKEGDLAEQASRVRAVLGDVLDLSRKLVDTGVPAPAEAGGLSPEELPDEIRDELLVKSGGPAGEALRDLPLAQALNWAEDAGGGAGGELEGMSRLGWAALQPCPGASAEETEDLVLRRMFSLEAETLGERLDLSYEYAEECRSRLAAKVALVSLKL